LIPPQDRKPEDLFALKSFLFSQEPNEWSFGVAEKLGSKDQVIDITDDVSGETTQFARWEIPMYGAYAYFVKPLIILHT
jgi:hypothetical protein